MLNNMLFLYTLVAYSNQLYSINCNKHSYKLRLTVFSAASERDNNTFSSANKKRGHTITNTTGVTSNFI